MFGGSNWSLDMAVNQNCTDGSNAMIDHIDYHQTQLPIPDDPSKVTEFSEWRYSLSSCMEAYEECCLNSPDHPDISSVPVAEQVQHFFQPQQDQFKQVVPAHPPMMSPVSQSQYHGAPNYAPCASGPPPTNSLRTNPQSSNYQKRKPPPNNITEINSDQLTRVTSTWKKHGKKEITGSPYPRLYYRCNIGKGCAARMKVDVSKTDPNKLVVMYFGQHTHMRSGPRW